MSDDFKIKSLIQHSQNNNFTQKNHNQHTTQDLGSKKINKNQNCNNGSQIIYQQKKCKQRKGKKLDFFKDNSNFKATQISLSQNQNSNEDLAITSSKNDNVSSKILGANKEQQINLTQNIPQQNQQVNFLLGFKYQDDEPVSQNQEFPYNNTKKINLNKDYLPNLYDPNETLEWKDVVQVIYNKINTEDIQCPICMESLPQMVAPRITKCGHIYCWPCILQYLAFEKEKTWKKCPLCNEFVYKHELKSVKVNQNHYYKVGDNIKFNLMMRGKENIIVKDKFLNGPLGQNKLYTNSFPTQEELEYHQTRLVISNSQQFKELLKIEQYSLQEYQKLMQSSQEFEQIPFIQEAFEHCSKELTKISKFSKNQDNILNEQLFESTVEMVEENEEDFYYFYQSSTGENLFLHPLTFKILQQQYCDIMTLPLQIEGQILEINHDIADKDDKEFSKLQYLNHLPDGISYGFVEIDLSTQVSEILYKDFEKQISYRERQRKKKAEREEIYSCKIQKIQNQKFEDIKKQAINSMVSIGTRPTVVKNVFQQIQEQNELEEQEEIKEHDNNESQGLWFNLGALLANDPQTANKLRRDTFDNEEINSKQQQNQTKIEKKQKTSNDDPFFFASSFVVVQENKKKIKKKH